MKGSSFYGKGSQSKSPAKKELIGGQENLPNELKAKIEAAPGKMYNSPAKHSSNRASEYSTGVTGDTHNSIYGKGHTNKKHPNYWKVEKTTHVKDTYMSPKEQEQEDTRNRDNQNSLNSKWMKKKDSELDKRVETRTKDDVGKIATSSKSKTKTKSKKGKLPSYEASYTAKVADKWKDKGGKEAYIKAAKAYNAKKRK